MAATDKHQMILEDLQELAEKLQPLMVEDGNPEK